MLGTTNDARKKVPSSNMSDIARRVIGYSMVGLAQDGSRTYIGSRVRADSSRCFFEYFYSWKVTIIPLRMFFYFQIQRFLPWCHSRACSAMNAIQPHLLLRAIVIRVLLCLPLKMGSSREPPKNLRRIRIIEIE
jgi:hypothetical protein